MTKVCKIIINDETTCKISGLELQERKSLTKLFEYAVPGARYLPSVRLGRWNGKVSFFSLGGSSYINLLPEIIPVIDNAGYDIELVDTRDYVTSFEFDHVTEETLTHKSWPKGHPAEGKPIVLRDYQIEVVNNFLSSPQSIQQVATAAGKTICTAMLSMSVEPYGRSIVIVPNVNLVTQTELDYINLGLDVGVYYGGRKEIGKKHTICTWQSLNILLKNTKEGSADITIEDFLQNVVCVISDECLAPGTLIQTPTGLIPIEKIHPGGKVISYDEVEKKFIVDEVVKLHTNLPKSNGADMFEFELEDGRKIQITGNHKVLTDRGWMEASQLEVSDNIISY